MKDVSMADRDSMHAGSIRNITLYKVTVSIIFGLLGFAVNFRTINFAFPVSSQYLGGTRPSWSLDTSKMLAFLYLTPIY